MWHGAVTAGGSEGTFNVDGETYATAAAAGLSAGTMTVTGASVGTKQGFSIIKYDGAGTSTSATPAQIPHGLSQASIIFHGEALYQEIMLPMTGSVIIKVLVHPKELD